MQIETGNIFLRTEWLIGEAALQKLSRSKVAVFGIGGVGSYAVEALARSGIGNFVLIDHDVISETNINRQIHALHSTKGMLKVDAMANRIMDINPSALVLTRPVFFLSDTSGLDWDYDYIIDAVDTVTAKVQIILAAKKRSIPVISSMGAGNKLNPACFEVADIYQTSVCPLAKIMRSLLRQQQVDSLKVVYSKEKPHISESKANKVGSVSFVPPAAGLIIAGEVIKDLAEFR